MIYEYRVYEAANKSAMSLLKKVVEASVPAFQRHGMRIIGCWTTENCISDNANRLIYLLEFRDLAHLESAWAAYFRDTDVREEFVALTGGDFGFLKNVSNYTMTPTSFSPPI